jgi:hypothetical protein
MNEATVKVENTHTGESLRLSSVFRFGGRGVVDWEQQPTWSEQMHSDLDLPRQPWQASDAPVGDDGTYIYMLVPAKQTSQSFPSLEH